MSSGFPLVRLEKVFLRLLSFAVSGAGGALLDCISILCLAETWALDVPSLLTPCKGGRPPMAKCRSQLASSRQWSYPVWQPPATAVSYPQLVPYPKLQTLARCGRQHWQPPSPSQADAGSRTTQLAARQRQRRCKRVLSQTGWAQAADVCLSLIRPVLA